MSEATEKQTAILLKNGFTQDQINGWNKAKISEEIKKIYDNKGWDNTKPQKSSQNALNAKIGATEGLSEVKHVFQNAYEFGKAGDRITIRFWDVEDFKKQVEEIQRAKEALGLFDIEKV